MERVNGQERPGMGGDFLGRADGVHDPGIPEGRGRTETGAGKKDMGSNHSGTVDGAGGRAGPELSGSAYGGRKWIMNIRCALHMNGEGNAVERVAGN